MEPLPLPNDEAVQSIIDVAPAFDPKSKNMKPGDLFETRFLKELKASGFVDKLYSEKVRS